MTHPFCIIFLFYIVFLPFVSMAEDLILPQVVKVGTPGELLNEDTIVPGATGETAINSPSGSIQNSLQNQLPVSFSNYGQTGMSQIRGIGPSASDVDVQAFGISLNPASGTGFDLSSFPAFLWAQYRFQMGPSLNAMNPSAAAGSLTLTPWTSVALTHPTQGFRATGLYSTLGIQQFSAAAKGGENVAVIAGYSTGKINGPSVGVGTHWEGKNYEGGFHLLATQLDQEVVGSIFYPTPDAKQKQSRIIPVLQNDFQWENSRLLKTVLFFDGDALNYKNPTTGEDTDTVSNQVGIELSYFSGNWKWGLNSRRVGLNSINHGVSFGTTPIIPEQWLSNFQVSRIITFGSWTFEPMTQGIWATGYGILPQGSLGLRRDLNQPGESIFSRLTFSHRVPTLMDRYGNYFNFVGNPDLLTESDWTGILGGEKKGELVDLNLQIYTQLRQNARVLLENSITNLNTAYIGSLIGVGKIHLTSSMDFFSSFSLSRTYISALGKGFPYIPTWTGLVGANFHEPFRVRGLDWSMGLRSIGERTYSPIQSETLSAYTVLDTNLTMQINKRINLSARIDNIFDEQIQITYGYPIGRMISFFVSGEI